nr:MAG TPA: hypothetical protein [Bacteriophage sp.]
MVTQKDIHNSIVVNASDWQKSYLSLQCGGDVEKIKKVEQTMANMINGISKALENSGTDYLNEIL